MDDNRYCVHCSISILTLNIIFYLQILKCEAILWWKNPNMKSYETGKDWEKIIEEWEDIDKID